MNDCSSEWASSAWGICRKSLQLTFLNGCRRTSWHPLSARCWDVLEMSMARRNSMIDLVEVFFPQKNVVCVYRMSFSRKSRPSAGPAFVDQRIDDDTVKLRRQQFFRRSWISSLPAVFNGVPPASGQVIILVASKGLYFVPSPLWAKLSPNLGEVWRGLDGG